MSITNCGHGVGASAIGVETTRVLHTSGAMANQATVEATLAQRATTYGDFTDHARICQMLKDDMVNCTGSKWKRLSAVQKQALEVIVDKIARILSGDPDYADNWHDIQGYAKLAEERLPQNAAKASIAQKVVDQHRNTDRPIGYRE